MEREGSTEREGWSRKKEEEGEDGVEDGCE